MLQIKAGVVRLKYIMGLTMSDHVEPRCIPYRNQCVSGVKSACQLVNDLFLPWTCDEKKHGTIRMLISQMMWANVELNPSILDAARTGEI